MGLSLRELQQFLGIFPRHPVKQGNEDGSQGLSDFVQRTGCMRSCNAFRPPKPGKNEVSANRE